MVRHIQRLNLYRYPFFFAEPKRMVESSRSHREGELKSNTQNNVGILCIGF